MPTRHGWKSRPSPRRGFTIIDASRKEAGSSPVVLAVHDSHRATRLFRTALDQAMSRECDLVVLDCAQISLQEELERPGTDAADVRERRALRALRASPHVDVIRQVPPARHDLESTVAFCEAHGACLLIVAAAHIGESRVDTSLARRLFNGAFDLLVITEPD